MIYLDHYLYMEYRVNHKHHGLLNNIILLNLHKKCKNSQDWMLMIQNVIKVIIMIVKSLYFNKNKLIKIKILLFNKKSNL